MEDEEESGDEEEEESQIMDIEEDTKESAQSHVLGSKRGGSDSKKATSPSGEANQVSEREKRLQFFQKRN